jgi:putative ABC transport system permease protein
MGYRLVGVTTNLFTQSEYAPGRKFQLEAGGRFFDDGYREAVVGSFVAQRLNLKVGSEFHPFHGLIFDEKAKHSETYVVVGILEPSNTPADRVIWIPLAGLQNMSGHLAETATDVSAVLVRLRTPIAGQQLYNKQGNRLTWAWPTGQVMAQLFDKIGWFDQILALVAYLVALVAAGSILASIYNSMNARRRDIAILRALGARRRTIFSIIVLEAVSIAAIGMVFAFALHFTILSVASSVIRAQTGVVLNPWAPDTIFFWAPLGMILLSALAGVVPALKAYRTNVASALAPES